MVETETGSATESEDSKKSGEGSEYASENKGNDEADSEAKSNAQEEVEEKTGGSMAPLIILALLGVILAIVVAGSRSVSFDAPLHNFNDIYTFRNKMEKMKDDFPKQYDVYWSMLRNRGNRYLTKILNDDASELKPLSFLVAGYTGCRKTVDCFVSRLASAFTSGGPEEHQYIDCSKFSGDEDKLKLFEAIETKLNGSNKFIVVNDIDKLKFKVAQLFLSFADLLNPTTSYPPSLLVFTTELPFSYEPSQRKRIVDEREVEDHFGSNVWAGEHIDHFTPLWSRIGDSLILIREEDDTPSCN